MFRNAARTALAMLAPQGSSDHATNAEIFFVKLPLFEELRNDCLLLVSTIKFWNEPRVFNH